MTFEKRGLLRASCHGVVKKKNLLRVRLPGGSCRAVVRWTPPWCRLLRNVRVVMVEGVFFTVSKETQWRGKRVNKFKRNLLLQAYLRSLRRNVRVVMVEGVEWNIGQGICAWGVACGDRRLRRRLWRPQDTYIYIKWSFFFKKNNGGLHPPQAEAVAAARYLYIHIYI
jgi:hypothetical protein